MYLLDTNHCSGAILGNANILRRLAEAEDIAIATCVIVQGELIYMAERSQQKERNQFELHQCPFVLLSLFQLLLQNELILNDLFLAKNHITFYLTDGWKL